MLEFVLPLDEPLELRGRVTDVNPAAENPTRFLVGIEFMSVSSAAGPIDRYLESVKAKLARSQS